RPAEDLGKRGTDEALIVVRGLLAAEDQIRLGFLDNLRERSRDRERRDRLVDDHDLSFVAAHRERLPKRVARTARPDRHQGHDGGWVGVLSLERHLDRVLVVGGDRPGDPFGLDRLTVRRHAHADRRVRDLLQRDQDLQMSAPSPAYQSANATAPNATASAMNANTMAKIVVPSVRSNSSAA